MQWDSYEFTVGQHFLSALINGDYSGLSKSEEKELDAFVDQARFTAEDAGYSIGHWADVENSENEFGWCEVTNMQGAVIDITYHVRTK